MNWLELIGAFGWLGVFLTSLVSIFLTHRITEDSERRRWIRDNKLVAFAELAEDLLSMGFVVPKEWDALATGTKVARVLLLLEDEQLSKRINNFVTGRVDFNILLRQADFENNAEAQELYLRLYTDSHALINDLRTNLLHSKTDTTNRLSTSVLWPIAAGIAVLAVFVIWLISILQ